MKKLLILSSLFLMICHGYSQTNNFDLSVGTTRYYDGCQSYGVACVAVFTLLGVEQIIGDTLIDSKLYSIVYFKSEEIWEDIITILKDTSYYRFENELLYKYTASGDSIVQDFSFSKGDSISKYYLESELSSFFLTPPKVIIYDTLTKFTDNSEHRIMWGDDTTQIYIFDPSIIPSINTFLDSVLIDREEVWLLPFGRIQTYYPYKPFYFVDSLGILYSEWNYRKMALVGVKKPNGFLYGQEVNFITNIDKLSTKVEEFELYQNYPNPFNPETQISFSLNRSSEINISVYNLLGQKEVTLFEGRKSAGTHKISFNATGLPSGIYFYRINSSEFSSTRKMLYVK